MSSTVILMQKTWFWCFNLIFAILNSFVITFSSSSWRHIQFSIMSAFFDTSSDASSEFDSFSFVSLSSSSSRSFDAFISYNSEKTWNDYLNTHSRREELLQAWDRDMKSKIEETISNQDHETKLQLQRELIYRQSLEQDEWVDDFFREIESQNSFAELLANHISEMTRCLHMNELTQWNINSVEFNLVSSSLSNISSSFSFPLKRILKPLSRKIRIEKATNDVQSKIRSIRFATNLYDVSRIIISRRLKKKSTSDKFSRSSLLTFDEEKALLNFIDDYIQLSFSARLWMMKEKAMLFISLRDDDSSSIEENWVKRFIDRHLEYKSRFSRHVAQDRYWNFDDDVFKKWFALFEKTIEENSISSDRMFNMNEKRFLMRVAEFVSKAVVSRSAKNVFFVHCENRKWFIIIDAISNDQSLDSMIIFEEKQIQKAWIDEYSEVVYEVSRNDWIDNDHEFAWLKQCFDVQINHLKDESKRLLMMNGHESHVSVEFIEYCW